MALYDTQSGHMFICEVNTVYDQHRTVSLMQRFEDAKVKVARAVKQLRDIAEMLDSSSLSMQAVFGTELPAPTAVHPLLLTWLDSVDLTMGASDEDVLSLNFSTFRLVVGLCRGDLAAMARCVQELRNVWSVSTRRPLDLGQPGAKADLEVQVGMLDSPEDIASLGLSPLSLEILSELPTLPDGWRAAPDLGSAYVTYFSDSVAALVKPSPAHAA